jgi:hypothetical protein
MPSSNHEQDPRTHDDKTDRAARLSQCLAGHSVSGSPSSSAVGHGPKVPAPRRVSKACGFPIVQVLGW